MTGAGDAVNYYMGAQKEDYYLHGVDQQGQWFGSGVESLGLGRHVRAAQFRHLLGGYSPDGQRRLVQNAGDAHRDCGWDMTFNAPKAVSVLWAMSEPSVRRQIEAAHQRAVQTALRYAEQVAGVTRRGPGGRIKEAARLLWAMFPEGSSRAQDPHLHTHAFLLNIGGRRDGTFGALHTPNLFRWKLALGALYLTDLAAQLSQGLKLTITPEKVGFGIREVPQTLCGELSQRRRVIEQVMDQRGLSGPIAARSVAKATRPAKENVPAARLFASWQQKGQARGWGPKQAAKLVGPGHRQSITESQLMKAVIQATRELPAERQYASPLVRQAARVAFAHGAEAHTLFACLRQLRLPDGKRVLWALGQENRTTTRQDRSREQRGQPARTQTTQENQQRTGQTAAPAKSRSLEKNTLTQRDGVPERRGPVLQSPPPGEQTLSGRAVRPITAHDPSRPVQLDPARVAHKEQRQGGHQPPRLPSGKEQSGSSKGNDGPRQSRARAQGRQPQAKPSKGKWGLIRRGFVPPRPPWIRVEWRRLFPKAPQWSPASKLKAPVIVVGHRDPRWWSMRWKLNLPIGELRVQDRILFRNVPQWHPLYGLTAPALRFTLRKSDWTPMKSKSKGRTHQASGQGSPSKDHGHSH